MSRVVQGVGVSGGVAVGRVWVMHPELLPVVPEAIPPERVQAELEFFQATRETARREIEELKERVREAVGGQYAGILDAQLLILDDPRLVRATILRVRVGRVSASWALKEVVAEFLRRFEAVEDAYLRERGGELQDVHRRLQRLLRGVREREIGRVAEGPMIVVAHTLGPSDAVALIRRGIVALATDVGGRTSHTAILAQALSVPAVAALHDVSRRVRDGDAIIIDGDSGEVRLDPSPAEIEEATCQQREHAAREEALYATADGVCVTADGVPIELRANLEFPDEAETALRLGARGVGLYRSEFLFLAHSPELPGEEEHFKTYSQIAECVAPHPATMRTLDLGGEKYFHDVLDSDEPNPVLGLRAVRLCLKRPDIFRPQIRGVLRAAARFENLQVMLPLVVTTDEIREVRKLFAIEAERLKSEGESARADLPIGIMVEVPAAANSADILAREADFFSIGSNDLIQYSLAVDRENDSVAYLYQPLHPGLLRMLQFIVDGGVRQGIPVSLCGEMAADPALSALLLGLGLRELSMKPRAIPAIREAIGRIEMADAVRAAQVALDQTSASDVERRLKSMV